MKSYDYIIVGAGSAGCLLANRLSKDPNNNVLLLEAGGPDKNINIHIPGAYLKIHKSKEDWGFWTEEQTNILNRKIYLPRGKTLGGSSSTNAMAYVRGNPKDYDHWEKLGNKGWSFKDLLPYFKKSENHEHIEEIDSFYHGSSGELSVSFPKNFKSKYLDAFISSCNAIGIPLNNDYNGKKQVGACTVHSTIKNGKRASAAVAFLKPILNRSNLTVITFAKVEKIVLKNKLAVSVQYKKKNKLVEVFGKKEIILSAGSYKSPQILMLSGIGDDLDLNKHGIECLHKLNGVGKNLQDHLFYPISQESKTQDGINHYIRPVKQLGAAWNYFIRNKGVFCSGPLEGLAFFDINQNNDQVNFQLHFTPIWLGKKYGYDAYSLDDYPRTDGFTILPTLLHPKSRGTVSLSSSNPEADPIIQPNFLKEKEDLEQLVKGGKIVFKIMEQEGLKRFSKSNGLPLERNSDKSLIEHIKKTVETVYHPVGTCKMGNDKMAVVNCELKVHGIKNLRVVDASIMPKIVSGNTNAPVYMIAEKASDMILNT